MVSGAVAGNFDFVAIFAAGIAAGMVNSIAGGGTLLSFPVLLWLGRDPIVANATNAISLFPGSLASAFGFRREIAGVRPLLMLLLPPSVIGGILGAGLLLVTPSRVFSTLIPYLILMATALIALKHPLERVFRRPSASAMGDAGATPPRTHGNTVLVVGQLLVAIYGGYFGAAMGIMMLAAYGLAGLGDIHQRNGLKTVSATVINGIAGVVFVVSGAVAWKDAALLSAGAVIGGYAGAAVGRRMKPRAIEILVVLIGLGATVLQLVRSH
jgi:uncharacterized membrane protein YfcA